MAGDEGQGTTLTFGTSGFAALITSIGVPERTREAIETTHLGTTTAKTFQPSDLYDGGEMAISYQFDPALTEPITGAAETVTITFPSANTYYFSGFWTSVGASVELGPSLMAGNAVIKVSGAVSRS